MNNHTPSLYFAFCSQENVIMLSGITHDPEVS